jgi:hypothetical protein
MAIGIAVMLSTTTLGAGRFACMAGGAGDGTAKFYLKQCRIGS